MKTRITHVHARRIWDSRGRPTVEVDVTLQDGSKGTGMAPAGASRGSREALELRDGGESFNGLDVSKAVSQVNLAIAPHLVGMDALDQSQADQTMIELDGTPLKSHLGANGMIAVRTQADGSISKTFSSCPSVHKASTKRWSWWLTFTKQPVSGWRHRASATG